MVDAYEVLTVCNARPKYTATKTSTATSGNVADLVRACRFESCLSLGDVAQLGERLACNQNVASSILAVSS